jgi:hypothetical protein
MTAAKYRKPEKRIHRGFYYLNDETVINSLSAVEAGKVDEVLAKVNTAREGGIGAGVGIRGAKIEGAKKTTSEFEEEMVRTRTRFSVFEIWYDNLINAKAVGAFEGWGPDILADVQSGDTVEFKARLELAPLQTVFRMFAWYAKQAKTPGSLYIQKGEDLKMVKESERVLNALLGEEDDFESVAIAKPTGDPGPQVGMQLADRWMIGELGHLSGQYTVVGQVDQVLNDGEEFPTLRLIHGAPVTLVELDALRQVVEVFVEPAKPLGLTISSDDVSIKGPAIWLTPIAIFR